MFRKVGPLIRLRFEMKILSLVYQCLPLRYSAILNLYSKNGLSSPCYLPFVQLITVSSFVYRYPENIEINTLKKTISVRKHKNP